MTAIEAISDMYAEDLLSRFEQIKNKIDKSSIQISDIQEPLISDLSLGHQNISGNLYRGTNKVYIPFIASVMGKRIPVWMTVGQMKDMGIWYKAGSRSVPVVFCEVYIKDTQTHKRSSVTVEEFDKMTMEEKAQKHLTKGFTSPIYHRVYNIEDTTFAEVFPKAMDDIRSTLGVDERPFQYEVLDKLVSENSWQCPIAVTAKDTPAGYDKDNDIINIHSKGDYATGEAYYSELLRAMARSTGSEMRMDRDIWSALPGDRLHESLVTELSAASMGCLLGLSTTMSENSLSHISEFISIIDGDRPFVYDAVKVAACATQYMEEALGLTISNKVDVKAILKKHYSEKSKEMEQKNEKRVSESRNFTPKKSKTTSRSRRR